MQFAVVWFKYASRLTVAGNHHLAVECLLRCCQFVPGNLSYRQALRKAEKALYRNNLRGSVLAPVSTLAARCRLLAASRRGDHLRVLEHAEAVLAKDPWDRGAQLHLARSADALGLPALALWTLQQAREKDAMDPHVNRALARLLEKQGLFTQAIALWELVREVLPHDPEARGKATDLAATQTIARHR
jgi:tetratricopeptide (TPR) repeat protein